MSAKYGFLAINKPIGISSFAVCHKLRKIYGIKKIGHTGTLDPFASGVLVIALGKATKAIPYINKEKKTYRTKILFGKNSDTLDNTSPIFTTPTPIIPSLEKLKKIFAKNFHGEIDQEPPKYSAIKINGKRAYQKSRDKEDFEIPSRKRNIYHTRIINYKFPELEIEIEVEAGFYIRSLARDLAKIIQTSAICITLERLTIGSIAIDSAHILDAITSETPLLDAKDILSLPVYEIGSNRINDFVHGRAFTCLTSDISENFLIIYDKKTIGIAKKKDSLFEPVSVFIEKE